MTTCTSSSITWSYGGGNTNLTLAVTNLDVSQDLVQLDRRQNTAGVLVFQTLANVSAQAGSWAWPSVNLAQGRYQMQGEVGTLTVSSMPFYIFNGSDISCLPGAPSVSVVPVSHVSTSHTNKAAIIAGSVVGVIVGISLAVAIILIWLRRRKRPPARGGFIVRHMGRWGSLASNASGTRPKHSDFANRHYHGHTESTSGMLKSVTSSKTSNTNPAGDFEGHVAEVGESEKTHSTYSHPVPLPDSLGNPTRHTSISSVQCPPSATDTSRSRTQSVLTSNPFEQQAQRIRSSMESSACLRTDRLSIPAVPPAVLDRSPSTPIRRAAEDPELGTEPASVKRSTSASGSGPHRTPRKPVPHYNPSEFPAEDGDPTRSSSTAPVGSSTPHSAGSTPYSGTPDVSRMPSLTRGRPVHYLIPDMPPTRQ